MVGGPLVHWIATARDTGQSDLVIRRPTLLCLLRIAFSGLPSQGRLNRVSSDAMLTQEHHRKQGLTWRAARSPRALAVILPLALAGLLIPAAAQAQTLDWDPFGTG